MIRRPPRSPLFPYTPLFRSVLLPPFPDCPTCGQPPTELLVRNDSRLFTEDRVAFGFRPCGHTFTADGEDLFRARSEEHTSELQSQSNLVCRLLLEKKKKKQT